MSRLSVVLIGKFAVFEFALGTEPFSQESAALAGPLDDDERDDRENEHRHRDPDIDSHTEELMGEIDAQGLNPCTPGGVPHDIQREQRPAFQRVVRLAPDPYQECGSNQVPYHLIQECRMEQCPGGARGAVIALLVAADRGARRIEFQPPGQGCRGSIQFLVEPVAQPPDRLGYQKSGGDTIGEQRHRIMLMTAPRPCDESAEGDAAPNAQSPIPDSEHFNPIAMWSEESFRRGDDVI